jgi:predicted small lipoprotein YifL
MNSMIYIAIVVATLAAGCGPRGPENKPITQVNAPQPTNIVTNVPPAK